MAEIRVNERGQLEVKYPGLAQSWVPAFIILPTQDGHSVRLAGAQEDQLATLSGALTDIRAYLQSAIGDAVSSIDSELSNNIDQRLLAIQDQLATVQSGSQQTEDSINALIAFLQSSASPNIQEVVLPGLLSPGFSAEVDTRGCAFFNFRFTTQSQVGSIFAYLQGRLEADTTWTDLSKPIENVFVESQGSFALLWDRPTAGVWAYARLRWVSGSASRLDTVVRKG